MNLSVVIVTWNSQSHITSCLKSLQEQGGGPSTEIIVVDNASEDQTRRIILRDFPEVNLIGNEVNLGFTRACNRGLDECSGEYILLLNPDTELKSGSVEEMIGYMEKHDRTGVLGPQLLFPDGRVQPSCRQFPTYLLMLWEFTGLRSLLPRSRRFGAWRMGYFDHLQIRSVDQPMGACLLIRKSVLDEVGWLDERFEMFFSDVDICRRTKDIGRENIYFPPAQVVHYAGSSVRRARSRMLSTSHRDCLQYFRKYRSGPLDAIRLWLLSLALLMSLPVRFTAAYLKSFFSA